MKDEIIFTPFYSSFLRLCAGKGKNPSTVADEVGIASGSPTAWKKGAIPRPEQREKLCKYFGVTDNVLLGYEKQKKPTAVSSDGQAAEFLKLFNRLSPEDQARELAYLRERVAALDK